MPAMNRMDHGVTAAFIAGDWGTSNLRLSLCDDAGRALETRDGPGAAAARGRFAEVFDATTGPWYRAHGKLPAILSGMVGSTFGWLEAPYLPCPAALEEPAERPVCPREGIFVVPGLRCTNPLGAPDVMRGEETQLLGARRMQSRLESGRWLLCLPGTHTKWVSLYDGVVQEFLTVPTGELFALLCEHSVLVRDAATPLEHRAAEFERGLAEAVRHPQVPLTHRLFQARSLRIDGQLAPEGAASWMSGLLIGNDVGGTLPLFSGHDPEQPVCLIGTARLMASYALALERRGRTVFCVDGAAAALAGLTQVFREREHSA
jgi:2-dehydro-3-deoxygalactonokinase